jgi:hypothetical protein
VARFSRYACRPSPRRLFPGTKSHHGNGCSPSPADGHAYKPPARAWGRGAYGRWGKREVEAARHRPRRNSKSCKAALRSTGSSHMVNDNLCVQLGDVFLYEKRQLFSTDIASDCERLATDWVIHTDPCPEKESRTYIGLPSLASQQGRYNNATNSALSGPLPATDPCRRLPWSLGRGKRRARTLQTLQHGV